ncbi:putative methyltransferase [Alteromonadaceae bacterium 2753L.S.0a.02]|nr:putative methyltransferase [Alteromonadaceae bacterium 2753L.S.0a.02]
MRLFFLALSLVLLASCGQNTSKVDAGDDTTKVITQVLAEQSDEVKARFVYRHPAETLAFFEITPGSTVVEALPGGGWYSKILLPIVGPNGQLVGADYAYEMWKKFGFFDDKFLEARKTWTTSWPQETKDWGIPNSATTSAILLGAVPEELKATADTVLFIRALHNLARFEKDGGYLTAALASAYDVLKPGGIVGVVQHQAREAMPDEWASGQNGYLKKSFVIAQMEQAGFEFVADSAMNENPKDQPTTADVVWRLPPTMYATQDKPELKAAMLEIGESNRMTLKFRKPE